MKITSNYFKSEQDKETLLVLFIKDDEDFEVGRLSFYLNDTQSNLKDELERSFNKLPSLLEDIYKKGLNNENLVFDTKITELD